MRGRVVILVGRTSLLKVERNSQLPGTVMAAGRKRILSRFEQISARDIRSYFLDMMPQVDFHWTEWNEGGCLNGERAVATLHTHAKGRRIAFVRQYSAFR